MILFILMFFGDFGNFNVFWWFSMILVIFGYFGDFSNFFNFW